MDDTKMDAAELITTQGESTKRVIYQFIEDMRELGQTEIAAGGSTPSGIKFKLNVTVSGRDTQ